MCRTPQFPTGAGAGQQHQEDAESTSPSETQDVRARGFHFISLNIPLSLTTSAQVPPLSLDEVTPLSFVAMCGFSGLARHLIMMHAPDVNARSAPGGTSPLDGASAYGHVDSSHILLDHRANANAHSNDDWAPLHFASFWGHLKVAQLLLKH